MAKGGSSKPTGGFSIPIKDNKKLVSDVIKTLGTAGDLAKEKQRTEQARYKAEAQIHVSDNELEKARMASKREQENNYTELMRVLTEHEKDCKNIHIQALKEVIQNYQEVLISDSDKEIKKRCLDTMDRLSARIEPSGNEELFSATENWKNSIRKSIPEA